MLKYVSVTFAVLVCSGFLFGQSVVVSGSDSNRVELHTDTTYNPILTADTSGWRMVLTHPVATFGRDGDIILLYGGMTFESPSNRTSVGVARIDDAIGWKNHPYPRFEFERDETWCEYRAVPLSLLWANDRYYLYFKGNSENLNPVSAIGVATSSNGRHWYMYGQNPVLDGRFSLSTDSLGYDHSIVDVQVVYLQMKFYAFVKYDDDLVRVAQSNNGLYWNIFYDNPVNMPFADCALLTLPGDTVGAEAIMAVERPDDAWARLLRTAISTDQGLTWEPSRVLQIPKAENKRAYFSPLLSSDGAIYVSCSTGEVPFRVGYGSSTGQRLVWYEGQFAEKFWRSLVNK